VSQTVSQDLVHEQLQYERVRQAKAGYDEVLKDLFAEKEVAYPPRDIYLRAFKFDKALELWASNGNRYTLIKVYEICNVSGELGPKRRQGDQQIPEGFYNLEKFNPVSKYHLSLKVDYPNASDRLLGDQDSPGGDIFIHGDCVTIGCLPIENEPIKELYWLTVLARQNGGAIPIHIFPFRMDSASLEFFGRLPIFTNKDWQFWQQFVPAWQYFESHQRPPVMSVLPDGSYSLNNDLNQVNN
jgi:murein L,D-transpeptidase YafK